MRRAITATLFGLVLSLAVSSISNVRASSADDATRHAQKLTLQRVHHWQAARSQDFALVDAIIREPAIRKDRNGRWVSWYRARLEKVGPGGRWAIARCLVLEPSTLTAARADQRDDLRLAMISYLASRRDPSLLPVLDSLMHDPHSSQSEANAAATGLARLATNGGEARLLAGLESNERTQLASLHGLRNVRTKRVLKKIVGLLDTKQRLPERMLVEALRTVGYLGSTWAWKATNHRADQSVRDEFRKESTKITLRYALETGGRVQRRARLSLAMVVEPEDLGWLDTLAAGIVSNSGQQATWKKLRRTLQRWWSRNHHDR